MLLWDAENGINQRVRYTEDGEQYVTSTAQEFSHIANMRKQDATAEWWGMLVDLDNAGGTWPHVGDERIDVLAVGASYDKNATGVGRTRVGVVTAIDGSGATVAFFYGYTYQKNAADSDKDWRVYLPGQVRCSVAAGRASDFKGEHLTTTFFDTSTTIPDIEGNAIQPAVGDLVVKGEVTAGTVTSGIQVLYHVHPYPFDV